MEYFPLVKLQITECASIDMVVSSKFGWIIPLTLDTSSQWDSLIIVLFKRKKSLKYIFVCVFFKYIMQI